MALKVEFIDQPAIVRYLEKQWLPLREQWAGCFIQWYRNFGARVTSPTESTNLNVKSYLINGRASTFRLLEAIKALALRQIKKWEDKRADEGVRTCLDYVGRDYLGSLPMRVSHKALELINREYRYAKAAFATRSRPAKPLNPCEGVCSISLQYGIPCRYSIFTTI